VKPVPLVRILTIVFAVVLAVPAGIPAAQNEKPKKAATRIDLNRDDARGQMQVLVDGREAIVYQYGTDLDLVHYYPVRSPSGKSLTVQKTDPFPHQRSIWLADAVQLEGRRKVSFYMAYYSKVDPKDPNSPYRDHVRHVEFLPGKTAGNQAEIGMKLLWEMDQNVPVLDETRQTRIVALRGGEYFIDLTFTVTASYGDVTFVSDWSHYAWPYVRMSPEFSEEKGGTIANSEGGKGQVQTIGKPAHWVDYSNAVEGVTEGLAIFSHSQNEYPHKWFNRVYGTFGPRRADARSGHPFVLKKGESLKQRVGILVHRGDVKDGLVAERYEQYLAGKL